MEVHTDPSLPCRLDKATQSKVIGRGEVTPRAACLVAAAARVEIGIWDPRTGVARCHWTGSLDPENEFLLVPLAFLNEIFMNF